MNIIVKRLCRISNKQRFHYKDPLFEWMEERLKGEDAFENYKKDIKNNNVTRSEQSKLFFFI